jgi:hypothetical protein
VDARGAGHLVDGIVTRRLQAHIGQPQLSTAALSAGKRPLGDTGKWVWSRKAADVRHHSNPGGRSARSSRRSITGSGIVLGWSAKAVDILARRCNLDTFIWPDGDLDSIGFRETYDGNHLGTEISSALISSLIHGTSFLVNTLGDESEGEPLGLIHVKDAMNATGDWNPRAPAREPAVDHRPRRRGQADVVRAVPRRTDAHRREG